MTLTILYGEYLVDEALIGELWEEWREQVDIPVQDQQVIYKRRYLWLRAGHLSAHSKHHVHHVLQPNNGKAVRRLYSTFLDMDSFSWYLNAKQSTVKLLSPT